MTVAPNLPGKKIGSAFTRTVALVAGLNLGYFFVEITVALRQGSVSLFADGIDFFEDTSINVLILLALFLGAAFRRRAGYVLAALILVPGLAALVAAVMKVVDPVIPSGEALGLTAAGALLVNTLCALLLVRFRKREGALAKAAFLSARNDVAANAAIIGAGIITALHPSIWPDLIVGAGIFVMNLDAAGEVLEAARRPETTAPEA